MRQFDKKELTDHFEQFRTNILGQEKTFTTPFGEKKIYYADWTASGRMYLPIEKSLINDFGPFVGNTHTETTVTGHTMTLAYHKAKHLIKTHVGGKDSDVIISSNSGMTGVVNKFQRILGLKIHEKYHDMIRLSNEERPILFCTHMEHHSNQTTWLETLVDVHMINATSDGLVDLNHLEQLLEKYKHRKTKIAAVTSCSNVTGIITPYHQIAKLMHQHGGFCFVDFACSAPYIDINMHPEDHLEKLDAIYFSPHKFLGGPGTTGILVFCSELYNNKIPDNPGGGTVDWTNPWGGHKYIDEIEEREDGGTPAFLQTIKVAQCIRLKEAMDTKKIIAREHDMLERIWERLDPIENLHILAHQHKDRLGVISFYVDELHYNLGVKLLNDRFGVQVRGGCSCAGTYGHYLLHVTPRTSDAITSQINVGNLSNKPGWIRMSIHPTTSDEELEYILDAVEAVCKNYKKWGEDYKYVMRKNDFFHKDGNSVEMEMVSNWLTKDLI